MITVTFQERPTKAVKTVRAYQWDYNQTLKIVDCPRLAEPEVHFITEGMEKALVVKARIEDYRGTEVYAVIPNQMFLESGTITAYLYDEEEPRRGETIAVFKIPVIEREQPEDYEFYENVSTGLSEKFKQIDDQLLTLQSLYDQLDAVDKEQDKQIKALEELMNAKQAEQDEILEQLRQQMENVQKPKMVLEGTEIEYNFGEDTDGVYMVKKGA